MTNENKDINELVAADDDPTVELEIPAFGVDEVHTTEADAKTYDAQDALDGNSSSGVTVSELKSDLRSRKKIISKLQYDIQQLHSKWIGLETEIGARESQTLQLNDELTAAREVIGRQEKRLKARDRKIKSLKFEIRQRDEEYRQLQSQVAQLQLSVSDQETVSRTDDSTGDELLQQRLERSESYADSLRQKVQDLIDSNSDTKRKFVSLSQQLDETTAKNSQLSEKLAHSVSAAELLQSQLNDIQSQHDEEIRLLRFDLGAAENTVVEAEELNIQLSSDLVDARDFKDELESMLNDVETQSSKSIEQLQKEINKLQRQSNRYEQKLTTKSEAISVLLAELAKKSEQIESIGEIEDVIQDIDERMSERSRGADRQETRTQADRVTRLLIGTVDDQLLRFPLFKDRLTIGRTKDNDIQLKVGSVSRRHAVIQTDGEATRIIDWDSKNGVHVNTVKVSEHFLCHGDNVMIGSARFRYEERKKR